MTLIKRFLLGVVAIVFTPIVALASPDFVIRNIQIEGAQRISNATIISSTHLHIGQLFTRADGVAVIRTLYQTEHFDNVELAERGNTLIIIVHERPVIASVRFRGNKAIKTSKLKPILAKLGMAEGDSYDPIKLKTIAEGIQLEYDRIGRHGAVVNTNVIQEPGNRVVIVFDIQEGRIATIRRITITGNQAFSQRTLRKQFKSKTAGILSFITHDDRYSAVKLDADLDALQQFYLDHGYLRFRVVSKQVQYTPDGKGVYITINIYEGPIYRISGYTIEGPGANNPLVRRLVTIQPNEIFSRSKILGINVAIAQYYANRGYAFPNIQAIPKVNDQARTVFLTFIVNQKSRYYVRNVLITGNDRTEDTVIRSQMVQLEGSAFSLDQINESKRRLANLPYLTNITVRPIPVPGSDDLVDLNYNVKEVNAGRAGVQVGYSDVDRFIYGANVSEPNFLGTGRYVSLGFQNSQYSSQYTFAYNNPLFTPDGVSQGFTVYYTHTTPSRVGLDDFDMDDYGGTFTFGIPVTEYDGLTLGGGFDHITIGNVDPAIASEAVLDFIRKHGKNYQELTGTVGWTHSDLDRVVFPTEGLVWSFDFTLGGPVTNGVGYYKSTFDGSYYYPLGHGFIVVPQTKLGYGNGIGSNVNTLPFFYNFYAGGIGTLPGYGPNSLGPKNLKDGNAAMGGNVELLGSLDLIFPNGITEKLRTSLFFAAGNIYQTASFARVINSNRIRTSLGLRVEWYSPIGPIQADVAWAINPNTARGDNTDVIGFSFGTGL